LHGGEILLDDLFERPAALARVPLDSPDQPDVRIRIHEYLDVAKVPHSRIDEQQDAVDDDYIRGLDPRRVRPAQVSEEIVLRLVDRPTTAKSSQMRAEQIIVERIRVIPIDLSAVVECQCGEILVVGVHVDERYRRCREMIGDTSGDSRLP